MKKIRANVLIRSRTFTILPRITVLGCAVGLLFEPKRAHGVGSVGCRCSFTERSPALVFSTVYFDLFVCRSSVLLRTLLTINLILRLCVSSMSALKERIELMMRELTGKVIDLLEDSSLEAIKVRSGGRSDVLGT
jgi:hypothetical protein